MSLRFFALPYDTPCQIAASFDADYADAASLPDIAYAQLSSLFFFHDYATAAFSSSSRFD